MRPYRGRLGSHHQQASDNDSFPAKTFVNFRELSLPHTGSCTKPDRYHILLKVIPR